MSAGKVKVSVIVPVYKVETFIVRCAESLLSQTMEDAEFIFVDDASPDGSMRLLEECIAMHPERHDRVKILRHERNRGLPAARNTGMAAASGEYIYHCDSDDFADACMLEKLYAQLTLGLIRVPSKPPRRISSSIRLVTSVSGVTAHSTVRYPSDSIFAVSQIMKNEVGLYRIDREGFSEYKTIRAETLNNVH